MLALYRAGRQSEALEVYREGRTILRRARSRAQPELRELEAAILNQDEELAAPSRRGRRRPARPPRRSANRRRALLVACVALAVAGASVAAVLLLVGGGNASLSRVDFSGVGAVDPGSGRILSEVIPSASPGRLATDGRRRVDDEPGRRHRLGHRTSSAALVHTIPVGSSPSGIATGAARSGSRTPSAGPSRGSTRARSGRPDDPGRPRADRGRVRGRRGLGHERRRPHGHSHRPEDGGTRARAIPSGADGQGVAFGCGLALGGRPVDRHRRADRPRVARGRRHDPRRRRPGGDHVRVRLDLGRQLVRRNRLADRPAHRRRRREPSTSAARRSASPRPRSGCGSPRDEPPARRDRSGDGTVARRVDVGIPPVAIAASPTRLWVSAQSAPGPTAAGRLRWTSPLGISTRSIPRSRTRSERWSVLIDDERRARRLPPCGRERRHADRPRPRRVGPDADRRRDDLPFQLRRGIRYSNGASSRRRTSGSRSSATSRCTRRASGSTRDRRRRRVREEARHVRSLARRRRRPGLEHGDVPSRRARPGVPRQAGAAVRGRAAGEDDAAPAGHDCRCRPPARTCSRNYRKQRSAVLVRNPHFHVWSDAAQPQGFPNRIVWTPPSRSTRPRPRSSRARPT